jgi:hypothetical protein
MRWRSTETPSFAGVAGSEPAIAEVFDAVDRDGNIIAAITKSATGAITFTVDGDEVGSVEGGDASTPLTSVPTAAGTTTLTVSSDRKQQFTGVTTQTVVLPVVSTLPYEGFHFEIINDSSGSLTINSSGGDLVQTMIASSRALFTAIALTGTDETSWTVTYLPSVAGAIVTERSASRALTNVTIDSATNDVRSNAIHQDGDTSLPGTCAIGDVTQLTDGRVYVAFTTNVWTEIQTGKSVPLINAQTGTTYTLTEDDNGAIVTLSNADPIAVTVPSGLGAGFSCVCIQIGVGVATFTGSGATVNNADGFGVTLRYAPVSVVAYAANVFAIAGVRA